MKKITTQQAAKILGVCKQRIVARIQQGHFPGHTRCECGHSFLIPFNEITPARPLKKRKKK